MAALRGTVVGRNGNSIVTRLSSKHLKVCADTWSTFITVEMLADGSASIVVRRDGMEIGFFSVEKEK